MKRNADAWRFVAVAAIACGIFFAIRKAGFTRGEGIAACAVFSVLWFAIGFVCGRQSPK